MDRRHFLIGTGAFMAAGGAMAGSLGDPELRRRIEQLERRSGGRLGVAVHDTATGSRFDWRGDEPFPMCSTFKFLLAGALLHRADHGRLRLSRAIPIARADLLPHSPFTASRRGRGASVAELARAIMVESDNGAANLLLPLVEGPAGLTRFARDLGDAVTRLDRPEPLIGEARLGDLRDTTSPNAMVGDIDRLLLGPVLRPASRQRLTDWMIACRTGKARLRAGIPGSWRVGDKTGSGDNGTANDIAIAWRPGDPKPVLIAAYLTGARVDAALRESLLASVGRAVATMG